MPHHQQSTNILLVDPKTNVIIVYDTTWEQYEQLSNMFIDEFPWMTYLEGTLEIIMTTSLEHGHHAR